MTVTKTIMKTSKFIWTALFKG